MPPDFATGAWRLQLRPYCRNFLGVDLNWVSTIVDLHVEMAPLDENLSQGCPHHWLCVSDRSVKTGPERRTRFTRLLKMYVPDGGDE